MNDLSPEAIVRDAGGQTEVYRPNGAASVRPVTKWQPASELRVVNPVDLFQLKVPQREWIVEGWLPVGCVTANYGDGGVGKTLLAQQLMTAAALGSSWCGIPVMSCRAFGIFCEDDEQELHRRQDRICNHLNVRFSDLGNMRWASGHGADNEIISFGSDGGCQINERFKAITAAAQDFGARLVVFDTAADLFGGNENNRREVRLFVGHLNRLASDIGGAVLLNCHPSREGIKKGNLDGGSTAWNNSVRSRWSLARPANADAAALSDNGERVLTRRKANYASIGDTIRLRWVDGAFALMTPDGGIFGRIRRAAVEDVFLDILDSLEAQSVRVSDSRHAGNFAPKAAAKRPDAMGYTAREFEGAMARLFADRKIRLVTYGRAGDARQRIVREKGDTA